MKEFHGIIKNGCYHLSLTQSEQRANWLKNLKEGTLICERISVERKPKTWQQTKTHWGLAVSTILASFSDYGWDTSILLNLPKPTGVEVSSGLLQEYLYAACPTFNEAGERITLSKMDTKQASEFFDAVRNYAASQWSIYIPEPDPNWRDKE